MRVKFAILSMLIFFCLVATTAFAASNDDVKNQIYDTMKASPYFNTNKVFIDKFIDDLNKINFSLEKAAWKPIDENISADETSFKEINDFYYLVFKTNDDGLIGLFKFRCTTSEHGGFKGVRAFSYKHYHHLNSVDADKFQSVEDTVCK